MKMVKMGFPATGETQGARRATGVSPVAEAPGPGGSNIVDPEVPERPVRRRFSAEYKSRILGLAGQCSQPGEIGALLRREGLYYSHLTTWRRQREEGSLQALAPKKRGRQAVLSDPSLAAETAKLRRENRLLTRKLKQAELIIDIQKKASEMLGIPLETAEFEEDE